MGQEKRLSIDENLVAINCSLLDKGFTLVELMVVIAIMGIIALFAGPQLIDFGPNIRIKAAARELHATLQEMKTEATKRNREVLITLNPVAACPTPGGGTYDVHIKEDNNIIFTPGVDEPLPMNDDSGDPSPDFDYDMPKDTGLCQAEALSAGTTVFRFTPQALFQDSAGNTPGGRTDFRIENDRGRKYEVQVSIAGAIRTVKCEDPTDPLDPCF